MINSGFLNLNKIYLPRSCAMEAIDWMYKVGLKELEGVALWCGILQGDAFHIKRTIIPRQKAGSLEDGLIYVVDGDELHRINLDLFDTGMQLIAQIHSHPGRAYHSETDDQFTMVTVAGGLSIVVPNFATGGLNFSEWVVFRLCPILGWVKLSEEQKNSFLQIV